MFSLSYTSAYDPYHTVFRYLVLLNSAEGAWLPYRSARVADFFLCFPWALQDVKAPRDVKGFARHRNSLVKDYTPSSYERVPNDRVVFERMEVIHAAAVSALAGAKMIEANDLQNEEIILNRDAISERMQEAIDLFTETHASLVDFLSTKLPQIDERGKDGIFARTRLGDYSYDIV
ncbi:hypothetical protein K3555_18320 [Leisingera sp. M527]|uniref:ABC-three component system middle component 5 n=1 Tax=Leisingera sp. M527 TaxID=2867014 RepID=UPI0021A2DB7D|nr:ABC-three component system middle component 5 [Leisingera sp. M527]UWQ32459.1 hypothetical protein K3555_18320 [Leisingera sp. M527]